MASFKKHKMQNKETKKTKIKLVFWRNRYKMGIGTGPYKLVLNETKIHTNNAENTILELF